MSPQRTGTNIRDLKLQINFDVGEMGKFREERKILTKT
jgi:hypothetical protein